MAKQVVRAIKPT